MQDIIDRLKIIRKDKKMNQAEFGEQIGVSRDVISNIELRRVQPKELFINTVCKTYNVDPDWLLNGEGNSIYIDTSETFVEALRKSYGLDNLGASILKAYLDLNEDNKKTLEKFIKDIAKGLE